MKYFVLFLFLIPMTQAADFKIEPVYGVERTQRLQPEPARYKTETFVGARALYGTPAFSLEFEVNTSRDTEEFPEDDLKITYSSQKALLGFRSYPIRGKYFGMYFRAGGRAAKITREITEAGVESKEEDPINFDPYAGTGLTLAFANNFALNAGATLVYNRNAEDEAEKYDTRYTFSFTIRAGSR
ncbi:MAG: hypothetical protein CME65_16110 [Halobacteriovoraceae bacterium]|nr:hypothetical protein [Halobacteriovoraceae bacterium]